MAATNHPSDKYAASELLHTITHELLCDYRSKKVSLADIRQKFILNATMARLRYITLVGNAEAYDSWVQSVLNQLKDKSETDEVLPSYPSAVRLQEKLI